MASASAEASLTAEQVRRALDNREAALQRRAERDPRPQDQQRQPGGVVTGSLPRKREREADEEGRPAGRPPPQWSTSYRILHHGESS